MEEGQRVRITRDDLYAQVWKEPATKVAARYGISSTALAKICRKLRVPTPDRGYWALRAVGRAPVTPRLGPPGPNTNLVYDLIHRAPSEPVSGTDASPPRLRVEVPQSIADKHPITEQLEDLLRTQARAKNAGVVRPATQHRCIDVSGSTGSVDRVVRIVDALVRACEARGHCLELTPVSPSRDPYGSRSVTGSFSKLVVSGQPVKFHIEEIVDRVPTLDAKVPATSALTNWHNRMVELRPSGRLELVIDTYGDVEQRTWRDGRSRRVENCLGTFIEAVERVADWCTRRDQETKRREEEQRRQRHRQAVLQEVQRRAETWESARTIERFLDAVVASDPAAADSGTSKGAVVAFVREQIGLHVADVTTLKGLAMEPT